jgi:putative phosphoribosyl transferase
MGAVMFADRSDAGRRLALALEDYKGAGAVVLAIPRGGVEVGYEIARHLDAELDIVVTRKLPFPDNPEAGFGAVAEDGSVFLHPVAASVGRKTVEKIVAEQKKELKRRIRVLRGGRELTDIRDRIVILTDDGIAMGSTMRASIALCRNKGAKKVVVGCPVTGVHTAREIERLVDEMVVLETPRFFQAVAQGYSNWYDVPDEEVVGILERWRAERRCAQGRHRAEKGGMR